MANTLSGFRAALLLGTAALSAAAFLYARGKGIPMWAALPVWAAFLVEYPFYLLPGFAGARERVSRRLLPVILVCSALAPYLIYSLGTGRFQRLALVQLVCVALSLSLWYVVLPAIAVVDAAFLALIASVLLGHYFDRIYVVPYPGVDVGILGHLFLVHTAAMALLVQRGLPECRYGFWPNAHEWRTGALFFLLLAPVVLPLGLWLKVMRLAPHAPWWKMAATFFGILWVVALSEEFLFRGVLQSRLAQWTRNRYAALIVTSLLFGAVHLPFRGFPNWRFAAVAAVAGLFYGLAYERTGSIRASMVAHALTVTTWRGFFA